MSGGLFPFDAYLDTFEINEAGNYEKSEELFATIKNASPTYRRADALWAESRRRKASGGGFDRLSKGLDSKKKPSTLQVRWIAATIVVVVVIARNPPLVMSRASSHAKYR